MDYNYILTKTASYYNITKDILLSRSRFKPIPDAKLIVMTYLYQNTKLSDIEIGKIVNVDRTTVCNRLKENRLKYDLDFKKDYDYICIQFDRYKQYQDFINTKQYSVKVLINKLIEIEDILNQLNINNEKRKTKFRITKTNR